MSDKQPKFRKKGDQPIPEQPKEEVKIEKTKEGPREAGRGRGRGKIIKDEEENKGKKQSYQKKSEVNAGHDDEQPKEETKGEVHTNEVPRQTGRGRGRGRIVRDEEENKGKK
jgi:hypothetical protein